MLLQDLELNKSFLYKKLKNHKIAIAKIGKEDDCEIIIFCSI